MSQVISERADVGPSGMVLVVDDDQSVSEVVARYLTREGFAVEVVRDGPSAIHRAARAQPDLIVLDVVLPGLDGHAVLRNIRAGGSTPVIMLTGRTSEADRLAGLDGGADDYLVKPFAPLELVARVKAVLRRTHPASDAPAAPLALGGIELDAQRRTVGVRGEAVVLTALEFDLLSFLMHHPREVFRRDALLERVWGFTLGDTATVTVHIGRLRTKIEHDPADPQLVRTVWGVGYSFDPPES